MRPLTPVASTPLRVAQWSTGTIGSRALSAIISSPRLELVGLYVHGEAKVGTDAGALCGLPDTGVRATNRLDDILRSGADAVLYMPAAPDIDQICSLLEAGINVVTTCGLFHHPDTLDPAVRNRVEAACHSGGASVHSTGSSPGFITEAVPLVLTSIQRRLDGIFIDEYADLSQRNSPELLFDLMGFGKPAAPFEQFRADYLRASFGPSLQLVADAVGLPLDSVQAGGELATAAHDTEIAAGTVSAGSVAAQRITICGRRGDTDLMRFRATWYCTRDLEQDWDLHDTGWHISVDGDAPLEVDLHMPIPLERMADISPAYTANRAVNAARYVCAAAPGIMTTLDLPEFVPNLG